MAAISTGLRVLCDSLGGYLLVVALTSALPCVSKLAKLPPQIKKSLKVHHTLPDLQEFNPVECLLLYLVAYPALVMYRSGNALVVLTLAVGLMAALACVIGPAMIKYGEEELESNGERGVDEEDKVKGGGENKGVYKKETSATAKMASSLTADTGSVPGVKDENVTPTTANKGMQADFSGSDETPKDDPQTPGGEDFNIYDLCNGCKQKLGGRRISNIHIRPMSKRQSNMEEDEDSLSVVTWDPAFTRPESLNKSGCTDDDPKVTSFHGGSAGDPRARQHRRNHSEMVSVQDASLIKEMDGNLIDSNLEPHYSNLIDSANAPIFGVDSAGVSLNHFLLHSFNI